MTRDRTGFVDHDGHQIAYTMREGGGSGDPLLVVHGGPAIPHDYLLPLEGLADRGRTVVFYDQLGCGGSDRPHDASRFTVEHFVAEIDAVRGALGLDRVHLLGHSCGGILTLEHALRGAAGLRSLVLASTFAAVDRCIEEQLRLVEDEQGAAARRIAERHTAAGTVRDPEFRVVVEELFAAHMTADRVRPALLDQAFAGMGDETYAVMWGTGGQFRATGELAGWDVRDRLPEVTVPALVTHGRHDYVTVALGEELVRSLPDARLEVFDASGHMAFLEETERYLDVVESFLAEVERR